MAASSALIQVQPGAVLDVSALPSAANIATDQTLRGAGTVTGDITIAGNHDPGPGSNFSDSLGYASSSRVSWALKANGSTAGTFDTIAANAVTIAPGVMLDLVFNTPGSNVDFSQPFWSTARSWTILTTTTRSGGFTLGSISNDALGNMPGTFGTFMLADSGGSILLVWSPVQAIATWRGTTNADWNLSTANWEKLSVPVAFQNGIGARIDDGTNVTAINLTEAVAPFSLTMDSSQSYSLGGVGAITGAAYIEKKGTGSLTLSSANSFTGGTSIQAGTLAISHAGALGSGPVTLSGGTWDTGALTPLNSVFVTADSTISGGNSGGTHGIKAISGVGTLTLNATSVFDLEGSLSSFAGRLALTGVGSFRLNGSSGSAAADFDLGIRSLAARNGGTYSIGSITGQSASSLSITSFTGAVTFSIGGNGKSTVFAGTVSNGAGNTSLTKTGGGTLTLSGTCSHTGTTAVTNGKLLVNGAVSASAISVSANATLGGSGNVAATTLASGAVLEPGNNGAGTLATGPLTLSNGAISNFQLGTTADRVNVTGNLVLNGTLNVTDLGGMAGTFTLFTYTGSLSGAGLTLGNTPAGSKYILSTTTPGQVRLEIIPESYDSWKRVYFSSAELANPAISGPLATPAGDNLANLLKYALGLPPKTPSTTDISLTKSAGTYSFTYQRPANRRDITYTVEVTPDLTANSWTTNGVTHTRIASGDPETWSAVYAPAPAEDRAFFRLNVRQP